MHAQIQEVISQGYKPVIYVDRDLTKITSFNNEINILKRLARLSDILVVFSTDVEKLHRLKKAYVFRYGYLPSYSEAFIKRKGGKIVSGNLDISREVSTSE